MLEYSQSLGGGLVLTAYILLGLALLLICIGSILNTFAKIKYTHFKYSRVLTMTVSAVEQYIFGLSKVSLLDTRFVSKSYTVVVPNTIASKLSFHDSIDIALYTKGAEEEVYIVDPTLMSSNYLRDQYLTRRALGFVTILCGCILTAYVFINFWLR